MSSLVFLVVGHNHETMWANAGCNAGCWLFQNEKLLRTAIDRKLNFNDYALSACKKSF